MLKKVLAVTLLLGSITGGTAAFADEKDEKDGKVIDERWGNPILVYGSALSKDQLRETREILDVVNEEDAIDLVPVNGEDLIKYLGSGNANSRMYSSALVSKGEKDTGVKVRIKTPENITEVTSTQYANAMITAGIIDSIVDVASPVKVTGESALTGIYKAYEDRGIDLDKDRMNVAQEELETTSDLAKTIETKDGLSTENLDQAMIDIKTNLADIKQEDGEVAGDNEVVDVVKNALKDNGLDGVLGDGQIDRLVKLAKSYQNTEAIDSDEVKSQLKGLADGVADKLKGLKEKAEDSGLMDKVSGFFKGVWEAITGWFK